MIILLGKTSFQPFPRWLAALMLFSTATLARAATDSPGGAVTAVATTHRNRANVLLAGDALSPAVVARLQATMEDGVNFFQPVAPVTSLNEIFNCLDSWLRAKQWDAIYVGMRPSVTDGTGDAKDVNRLNEIIARLKERHVLVIWGSAPPAAPTGDNNAVVRWNDRARRIMLLETVPVADIYGALVSQPTPGGPNPSAAVSAWAATVEASLRKVLLSRSTPWAERPPGEIHEAAHLLADPQLLASPDDLPLAKGDTATVYRAEAGAWQFNLHSFIAHHDGKFWAAWSSGRVDEDSSSQLIRYATSSDGKRWSAAQVLAPDPDGEPGPWRWMASGIYEEGGRLFALGSINQGQRDDKIWADVRLMRFEWTDRGWTENRVVADDCAVYFPPLKIAGRDFFVWRDSRAHFFTAYSQPDGAWEVTRLPGPLPDYRMSETSAYVDPQGATHLIIRDQGGTRRLYHSISYDAGATWTLPVKTNYPDAVSKNCTGRLSNGWYYLINNPRSEGADKGRDPLTISFSRDGWTFGSPMALRKNALPLRYPGKAKGSRSFQYSHAIEHEGKLWVIYATNKEDIEVTSFNIAEFGLKG